MAKLNQIIAIEKGIKSRVYALISEMHKAIQKPDLFNGLVRTYRPKDDGGEDLPQERKRVQFVVQGILENTERLGSELMNVTARKDWSNCVAKADVIVDGVGIVAQAPVTYLLFLEKQLTDLRTFIGQMPVLDEAESWEFDQNSGIYRTERVETRRTQKVQEPLVTLQPTKEHPGQVAVITKDVLVGYWEQVRHSGAMAKPEKEKMAERVEKLLQAVKQAREQANGIDEEKTPDVGTPLFNYILGR